MPRRPKEEDDFEAQGGEESISVCVRVRPFNKRELELQRVAGDPYIRSVVEMPDGMAGRVVMLEKDGEDYKEMETFKFTKSFWSIPEDQQPSVFTPVDQEDVYIAIGRPVLKYAFMGFNNCVFAYGQTGSGKTFSMMGDFTTQDGNWKGNPGIIPRMCRELFERIEEKKESVVGDEGISYEFEVKLSAIEIYNEQVKDLFWMHSKLPNKGKNTVLKVRKHPTEGAFVDQLTQLTPKTWQECMALIAEGMSERTVAATLMNPESSRSHSVFQISYSQSETFVLTDEVEGVKSRPQKHNKQSKINLVDLAGSERLKKSGAQGQHLKEAAGINQSLSTLKKVIDALVTNSKELNPKRHIMVPYRESTLTLLLSHSLGGNSKTTMVACVSPHYDNQEETVLTMRYANRTKGIVNNVKVNEDNAAKQSLQLKQQMIQLQRKLLEGSGDPEEIEELRDQLDVGREAMHDLEEEKMRLEEESEKLKEKAKKEEGVRFANAFYNSIKMMMVQQQMEEVKKQADELDERYQTAVVDTTAMYDQMEKKNYELMEKEELIRELESVQDELAADAHKKSETAEALQRELFATERKLQSELEKRFGLRLIVARMDKIERERSEAAKSRLQEEQDQHLATMIRGAAEQYEEQVRQFADTDAHLQRKCHEAEAQLQKANAEKEDNDNRVADLKVDITIHNREHSEKVRKADEEWRHKYDTMKADLEQRITNAEQEYFDLRTSHDKQVEDVTLETGQKEMESITQLESNYRERSGWWVNDVANATRAETSAMVESCEKAEKQKDDDIAQCRSDLQDKITDWMKRLRQTEAELEHHTTVEDTLRHRNDTLSNFYEALMQELDAVSAKACVPSDCSLLAERLRSLPQLKSTNADQLKSPARQHRLRGKGPANKNLVGKLTGSHFYDL